MLRVRGQDVRKRSHVAEPRITFRRQLTRSQNFPENMDLARVEIIVATRAYYHVHEGLCVEFHAEG